ncbi:MAG: chemotaxis protein CheB [Selenomonadaceae bacterium]|nr:chemotaxis protein CheB [Selenomonadaceae bacterium]
MRKIELVAMGSSTGGVEALAAILPKLKPPFPPVVVVQHIPAGFSRMFAERMDKASALTIKEAEDGEFIQRDCVYIAPGGLHMKLVKVNGNLQIKCFVAPPVHSCRPAVDILFFSVAELVGEAALGVILTGIGKDGAAGLLEMRKKGALTLGQDEATSAVYGMPKSAFDCGAVLKQVPLDSMALTISSIVNKN